MCMMKDVAHADTRCSVYFVAELWGSCEQISTLLLLYSILKDCCVGSWILMVTSSTNAMIYTGNYARTNSYYHTLLPYSQLILSAALAHIFELITSLFAHYYEEENARKLCNVLPCSY